MKDRRSFHEVWQEIKMGGRSGYAGFLRRVEFHAAAGRSLDRPDAYGH